MIGMVIGGATSVPEALGAVCEYCGKTYDHLQILARKMI